MWLEGGKIITAEVCPDHVHASGNTAENDSIRIHGISEGEKQYYDISEMEKHEIQL